MRYVEAKKFLKAGLGIAASYTEYDGEVLNIWGVLNKSESY